MTTPVELIIEGKDNSGGAFSSASGGLAKIGEIAGGILASEVFTKLAEGAKEFAVSIVNDAREAALVQADLNAVIESTGGAAGVTADMVNKLASSLQYKSKYEDESIISGEKMLLQFQHIGSDIFPRATQAALDFASRTGKDLPEAFTLIGRALENPEEGIGRINTQFKLFDKDQLKVVENMAKSGDLMGAQGMILDALTAKVGGSAASQVTAWGNVEKHIHDMKDELGAALLPTIDKFGDVVSRIFDNPSFQEWLEKAVQWLGTNLPKAFDISMQLLDKIKDMFNSTGNGIQSFIEPFLPALNLIVLTLDKMRPTVEKVVSIIGTALGNALQKLSSQVFPFLVIQLQKFALWFSTNRPLIELFVTKLAASFAAIVTVITGAWSVISPILSGLFSIILDIGTLIMQVATGDWSGAWTTILNILQTAADSIISAVTALFQWIASWFGDSLENIKAEWIQGWNNLKAATTMALNNIKVAVLGGLQIVINYFKNAWNTVINDVSAFVSNIGSKIQSGWNEIVNSVYSFSSILGSAIYNAFNNAYNGLSSIMSSFISLGSKIISNIVQGLENNASSLLNYLKDIITNAMSNLIPGFSFGTSGGGGGGCFIAGTMVLMSNGDVKRIEEIEVGEYVLSYDTETGDTITNKVIYTLHHMERPEPSYLVINGHLGITPNHCMYINGNWRHAEELHTGDILLGVDNMPVLVYSITKVNKAVPVYNLHTENEVHNYFAAGVLVHNDNKKASGTNGWEEVPSGYPNDTYPILLTSGEHFAVVPPGNTVAMPGAGSSNTHNNYYNAHINVYNGKVDQGKAMRGLT